MSAERPRIAILASGSGSTAEAFIEGTLRGDVDATVPLVITNNPDAGVLKRVDAFNARGQRIIKRVINSRTHPGEAPKGQQTTAEAQAIVDQLDLSNISLVLMLGYMKKIVAPLVNGKRPVLNTHPGLLPASAGKYGIHIQEFAIAEGHEFAGQTLHFADEDYDSGATVAEHKIRIRPNHTPETLFADVQVVEKSFLPFDVNEFIKTRLKAELAARRDN